MGASRSEKWSDYGSRRRDKSQSPMTAPTRRHSLAAVVVVSPSALPKGGVADKSSGAACGLGSDRLQMKDRAGSEKPALRNAWERGDSRLVDDVLRPAGKRASQLARVTRRTE
ncbi:hypothetical protein MTO96_019895 [Rhipicephalus appendiculatus]